MCRFLYVTTLQQATYSDEVVQQDKDMVQKCGILFLALFYTYLHSIPC